MDDDSITDAPDENEGTPAYLKGHPNVAAMRAHESAMQIPLERATAARIHGKRLSHADPAVQVA